MRLLLDTHALLWWLDGDPQLSPAVRAEIGRESNDVLVSAATAWEICTKFRLGKLDKAADVARDVTACLNEQGFADLPVTVRHGERAGALEGPHRDPFDRMLIAQALLEDLVLVSRERLFDRYGIRRLW
ncbi:MAG TPA: type II toxin-antitoxin system VapC family toxin [Kiloniellales bacterium]|nr:type II toxin-antitoxin system VapC family toxin [Kiloniellales bacterium]